MSSDNNASVSSPPSRKSTSTVTGVSAPPTFSSPPPPPPTQEKGPQRSLARAVYERRDEYTTPHRMRVKIGSWNVAAIQSTERDLKRWFVKGQGVAEPHEGLRLVDAEEDDQNDNGSEDGWQRVETVAHQEDRVKRNEEQPTLPINDPGTEPGDDDIDLYVLGLQEIVDITSVGEALRPYNDPSTAKKWKEAMAAALPAGYKLVGEQQLIGLYMVVYASPRLAPTISSVSTTSVGTGLMGYMGNKGAVMVRIVVGEATKIVFVNSHLAAGSEAGQLERRNKDASQIISRTRFEPVNYGSGIVDETGDMIGAEHFAFWFGDLNYRIGTLPPDDVRRLLMLHTRNEYDLKQAIVRDTSNKADSAVSPSQSSGPSSTEAQFSNDSSPFAVADDDDDDDDDDEAEESEGQHEADEDDLKPEDDPASLQTTLTSLLPHDQLHEQMRTGKAFHDGWQEGPVNFLPTYKYDVGSVGMFDSSEKKRGPSWCDRILYRTRRDYTAYLEKVKSDEYAKKRDAEMKARGLDASSEDNVLFDYDPDTDGVDDVQIEVEAEVTNGEDCSPSDPGDADALELECYNSHQRVLSSDHKPLDAVFSLTYDAVDLKLKAQITAEVAKEFDRDENEARPTITLVADQPEKVDDKDGLDFGDIAFDFPKTRYITLANTGSVSASIGLVQDIVPEPYNQWLEVRFGDDMQSMKTAKSGEYALEPGDTLLVSFTMHVRRYEDARALNFKQSKLEDVRVLRIKDGRDHFITMRGEWLNSCFGLSLEKLIRVPEGGVRSCSLGPGLNEQQVKWSAPRELFRLTEALEEQLERAVAEWGMKEEAKKAPWNEAGWPFVPATWTFKDPSRGSHIYCLRENLDTGSAFDFELSLRSVEKVEMLAEVLLAFLDSIDGGIVDTQLWDSLSKALQEQEKTKKPVDSEQVRGLILDHVSQSPIRSVPFTLITFMLARLVSEVAPLQGASTAPQPSVAAVTGIIGRVRGVSGTIDPRIEKRREMERRYTEALAAVMFKVKDEKAKEKKAAEERRRGVLAAFLHGKSED